MRLWIVLLADTVWKVLGCANSGALRDSEIITDPTLMFSVSPPVGWTYYPIAQSTGTTTIANFFPGQSQTQNDALQKAQNDINAAILEAFSQAVYPTTQVSSSVTYSPDPISNCYTTQAIPVGTVLGILAGGSITETATVSGTAAVTATSCPATNVQGISTYMEYIKPVQVSLRGGTTLTRYQWQRIVSEMQSVLSFRNQALFRTPITIT